MESHDITSRDRDWVHRLLAERIGTVESLLDIGAGDGDLLAAVQARGKQGVEPISERAALARSRGFDVEEGDGIAYLEEHEGPWEVITLIDVIEHIDFPEVDHLLRLCHERAERIVINIPNPWWRFWFNPDHVRPYYPDYLERYFDVLDREVEIHENLPGLIGRPLRKIKHGLRRAVLSVFGLDEVYHRSKIVSYTVIASRRPETEIIVDR